MDFRSRRTWKYTEELLQIHPAIAINNWLLLHDVNGYSPLEDERLRDLSTDSLFNTLTKLFTSIQKEKRFLESIEQLNTMQDWLRLLQFTYDLKLGIRWEDSDIEQLYVRFIFDGLYARSLKEERTLKFTFPITSKPVKL